MIAVIAPANTIIIAHVNQLGFRMFFAGTKNWPRVPGKSSLIDSPLSRVNFLVMKFSVYDPERNSERLKRHPGLKPEGAVKL
jgi:hypothetical protein